MRLLLYIFLLCSITLLMLNAIAKADGESDAVSKAEELLSVDTGVADSDEKPRLVRQFGFGGPGFGGPGFGGRRRFGRFGGGGGGGFGGRRNMRRGRPFGRLFG